MTGLRKLLCAGVLGLAGVAGPARAGDCCHRYVTWYEPVVCYETYREPYTRAVTKYDYCGRPYCAAETCYRSVSVPVKITVPLASHSNIGNASGSPPCFCSTAVSCRASLRYTRGIW